MKTDYATTEDLASAAHAHIDRMWKFMEDMAHHPDAVSATVTYPDNRYGRSASAMARALTELNYETGVPPINPELEAVCAVATLAHDALVALGLTEKGTERP